MGIFLNPGNEGFKSALNSQIYIDKTRLLEYTNSVLDSEQRYICVSRPRRFGKSITAEMLAAYYDKSCDSSKLFINYQIAKNKHFYEHLNKYDVIHIDINTFRNIGENTPHMVTKIQQSVIEELKECYPECITPQTTSLQAVLANVHKMIGIKFVIIIDEWDAVFRENKEDKNA